MTRIALAVEYDGSQFNGWQIQKSGRSVQEEVQKALSFVADHPVSIVCAGRTDTGVHASGQIIHMDSEANRSTHSWIYGANANLPDDVSIVWAKQVAEDFHARFSATERHYRYIILNRECRPSYSRNYVSWEHRPLDAERMHVAAQHLTGEHDFSSYRALACQAKHPTRHVSRLDVSRNDTYVMIDISANAFLHHMVRNIAGVLITIGAGEQPTDWSREVLEYRDRTLGGVTAPPNGLYLAGVEYPEEYGIFRPAPILPI